MKKDIYVGSQRWSWLIWPGCFEPVVRQRSTETSVQGQAELFASRQPGSMEAQEGIQCRQLFPGLTP